ncbi:MAG: hypothetical protein JXR83_03610 [Deltaproteobacteria bacterium]|nr:hypothetical protein [Deltaproteobacteria bacterium]
MRISLFAGSMTMLTGTADIERFAQPYCCAYPFPATSTAEFESVMFPPWPGWLPVGRRLYHRLSHWLLARMLRLVFGPMLRRILRQLPPPGLVEFLGAGPAPVYIGFGSMRMRGSRRDHRDRAAGAGADPPARRRC